MWAGRARTGCRSAVILRIDDRTAHYQSLLIGHAAGHRVCCVSAVTGSTIRMIACIWIIVDAFDEES